MSLTRKSELAILSLDGDLKRGGYQVQGQVMGDTDAVTMGQNWRVMGKSLSSFVDPYHREAFNGHVLASPDFSFTRYSSTGQFQAGTADNLLNGEAIQDISFTEQASPANNHQMTGLTIGLIVQHILQKHCNFIYDATGAAGSPDGIITQTDIDTGSTPVEIYNVSKSDSIWRTLQQIGGGEENGGEFYRPYFNRHNKFIYRQAPPFLSPKPTSRGTLTKSHIRGTVQVRFVNNQPGERVGQVQITAVKNSTTVYDSVYPANAGNGKIIRMTSGVWANTQARADVLAERLYKWKTRLYTITLPVDPGLILWGDDGLGLDLGDRLLLTYNGPAEDATTGAGVHLNLNAQSMFVYGINIRYDADNRNGQGTLTLEHDNG